MDSADSNSGSDPLLVNKKRRLEFKSEKEQITTGNHHASSSESWQETKASIKERTSCLVNSVTLSDITFLVGPNETPMYAHRTILSFGTPYFEKLFYGPMASKDNVHKIPDIEPEVFLKFLKYLYTDEFDETMDDVDVMLLLKPAKVYIVPHLANKCAYLLIDKMSPENVFLIYNRAIVFDEPKLADVCLRFLDRQIDKVIATEEFLDIDIDTLCTLLERDNLRICECVLFKAVLKWTEAECKRKELEITPINQRIVLGRAIHLVRFPAMTREEFSLEVVQKDILTKDEIISVFMNLCIGSEQKQFRPPTPFITERRVYRPKLHYLTRFADVLSKVIHFNTNLCTNDNVYNSSVKFRTDQRVFIHGIGIYAISSTIAGLKFNAAVSLCRAPIIPAQKDAQACPILFGHSLTLGQRSLEGTSRNYDFRMPFQVMFERPLEVRPDEDYTLQATLKIVRENAMSTHTVNSFGFTSGHNFGGYGNQIDAYYGTKGLANVNVSCSDGIKVNFTFPSVLSGESFTSGQIPQIIFSV